MIRRALLCALALAGCGTRDSYLCDYDEQCGDGNRCATDHRCTAFDPACDTTRRYTDHSGAVAGSCFDDRRVPLDPCAPGQPPAPDDDACAAAVCERDAACCTSGWSTSCVQLAEVACDVRCDTRIAVTAQKSGATELWDLRWTGTQWQARQRIDLATKLAWLAPGVGDDEPRLAGFVPGALVYEGPGDEVHSLPITGRTYADVTSADFDRDGRDTIALTSSDAGDSYFEIVKLDDAGGTREFDTLTTKQVDWGDFDHDAFPDAIAGLGSRVSILANSDGPDHVRTLAEASNETLPSNGANTTPGTAVVHGARLADVDGDGLQDFLVYGFQNRLHLGGATLVSDRLAAAIDCDPPAATSTGCDPATAAFSADIAPDATGPVVYLGLFPRRAIYRVTLRTADDATTATYAPLAIPPCIGAMMMSCPGFAAVVARDLDGDHILDVVAIDADLGIVTGLSSRAFAFTYTPALAPGRAFTLLQTSVSGVLMP